MGNAVHRNLVKLYGYCFEDNMKALVYEYMENGSLDKILYENNHGSIELVKLYAIVIDTANGIKYLHHELEEQIIHHDIKAANVLLDKNNSAKITDFGLARIMNRDVSRVDLTGPRGTQGYTAPEAWMPGSQVTFKCDVYSFGMMLFEVLGKRKNGRAENWFPGLVWNQFENGNLEHFLKDCGIAEKDKENANILCKVALWCVQDNPNLRPSMENVALILNKKELVNDPPCPSLNFRQYSSMVDLEESRRENIER
ncbi:Receptor-like protein kinase [Thalictrum thalictroides]|uniref:non-specific serine/threonine protein kinase n=1 Tax=Thalictrum thalictroides TaxID=46969 RepID=A0A7J6VAW0_THATH|nr:Receptor-like protein kinase [Thalictrum thalictroides]